MLKIIFINLMCFNSFFMFLNCTKKERIDSFSFPLTEYVESNLKIGGFYYKMTDNKIGNIFLLYSNGIYINCIYGQYDNFTEIESKLSNQEYIKKNRRRDFGIYKIIGDVITIEEWVPTDQGFFFGGPYYRVFGYTGKILNDTTYQLNEEYQFLNGKKINIKTIDEVYNFKFFSPKPDSTNNFIP